MYGDTITLFNRYKGEKGDVWYPTILRGVDLNVDRAAIVAKYGDQVSDNAKLHVKHEFLGGKKYLPPKEWRAQEKETLLTSLTFNSGSDFDFFIVGEWEDTDPINDNDYLDGFYEFANTRFDYVFAITSVAQYSVIPHFEIMAR